MSERRKAAKSMKGLPEYSDNDLLEMVKEFQSLSEEDKNKRRLGAGSDKIVYDIPDKNLVLKVPNTEREYNNYGLDRDYLESKLLNKKVPVETPVLIKNVDNSKDILIQRKLDKLKESDNISNEFYNSIAGKSPEERKYLFRKEAERLRSLSDDDKIMDYYEQFDKTGASGGDMHEGNLGLDRSGKVKALDVAPFHYSDSGVPNSRQLNEGLTKVRNTFADKMDYLKKPTIFRSIPVLGSLLGLGAAATSGDASASIPILNEVESLGNAELPKDMSELEAEMKAKNEQYNRDIGFTKIRKLLGK